jgi:hypothetical protein
MEQLRPEKKAECTMSTSDEFGYWVGVAEVIPNAGNDLLNGAAGAYVGVIGIANSESEFLANAKTAFAAMDFDLLDLEGVESIHSLEQWTRADESLREKIPTLSIENPFECGIFHCYSD